MLDKGRKTHRVDEVRYKYREDSQVAQFPVISLCKVGLP
jgi:hypothetical protein